METTINKDGVFYRSENTAERMEDALDKTIDDLVRKLRKNKARVEKKLRSGTLDFFEDSEDYTEDEEDIKIVKNKHFSVMPMDAEEADTSDESSRTSVFYIPRDAHRGHKCCLPP